MAELVYLDVDGKEVKREVKGRGRPPKGSEKRDDGNFYVPASAVVDTVKAKYITLDKDGNKVSEEPKGKGRSRTDFQLASDGEFKGHWVKKEATVSA